VWIPVWSPEHAPCRCRLLPDLMTSLPLISKPSPSSQHRSPTVFLHCQFEIMLGMPDAILMPDHLASEFGHFRSVYEPTGHVLDTFAEWETSDFGLPVLGRSFWPADDPAAPDSRSGLATGTLPSVPPKVIDLHCYLPGSLHAERRSSRRVADPAQPEDTDQHIYWPFKVVLTKLGHDARTNLAEAFSDRESFWRHPAAAPHRPDERYSRAASFRPAPACGAAEGGS